MKYTAPDGFVIESKENEVVTYTCSCDMPDGVYESFETTGANTPIGIQQIKVKRSVSNNQMVITITMSNDQELLDYIQSCQSQIIAE